MRFLDFGGELPKVKPQALGSRNAQLAENVDLYGGMLRPHRSPALFAHAVDERGSPVSAKMVIPVGDYMVGFPEDVHWVRDPRESAGADTVLFVRDGQLHRLSSRMVRAGTGPTLVGIDPPAEAPTVAVAPNRGCVSKWADRCADMEQSSDCSDWGDAYEVRGYRVTYVNECGEESAPSPVSNLVDIKNGDGAIVVDTNTPPKNAVKRRWYRSATTSDGQAVWLYVDEDVIADNTFIDDKCPQDLGEVLSTEDHLPPNKCLDGVALTRNMQTIVWTNNQFWVSEPRLPHAYRPATRVTLPSKIRFIASHTTRVEGDIHFDNVVGTVGYPYTINVRDDAQTTVKELEYWYPALSPFGWCTLAGGVYYTAENGLVGITGTSVNMMTEDYMTEREWQRYHPYTMRLTGYDQRVFMWYDYANIRQGLLLVLPTTDKRRNPSLSRLTLRVKMAYAHPETGMLMLIDTGVYKWGAGDKPMRYRWKSGIEVNSAYWFPTVFKVVSDDLPRQYRQLEQLRTKFAVWKRTHCDLDPVQFFDTYPEAREHMADLMELSPRVVLRLYADGEEIYTRPIRNLAPVMLKKRRRAIEWAFMVEGDIEIRELHLQKSHNDLQNDGGHA